MNSKERQRLKELKSEVKPLIDRVKKELKLTSKQIGAAVYQTEDVINKWASNTKPAKPSYADVEFVVKTLKELLESPVCIIHIERPLSEDIITNETNSGYEKTAVLVSMFYDFDAPTIDYPRQAVIGDLVEIEKKPAIIIHKIEGSPVGKVDGYIYVFDDALEPEIKYGWAVFIKKVRPEDLIPSKCYFFITKEAKCMRILEKIEQVGDELVFKMVSTNEKTPFIPLRSSQVEVICIIKGVAFEK